MRTPAWLRCTASAEATYLFGQALPTLVGRTGRCQSGEWLWPLRTVSNRTRFEIASVDVRGYTPLLQ
jgi:hypothetical protein